MSYEIKLVIDPKNGVRDILLTSSGKDRDTLKPMAFFQKVKPDLYRLRDAVIKKLEK